MNTLSDYSNAGEHLGCRDAEVLYLGFSSCMKLYLETHAGSDDVGRDAERARTRLLAARSAYWSHIQTHHCVHYGVTIQKESAAPTQRNVRPSPTTRKFAPFLKESTAEEGQGRRPWRFVPKPVRMQA